MQPKVASASAHPVGKESGATDPATPITMVKIAPSGVIAQTVVSVIRLTVSVHALLVGMGIGASGSVTRVGLVRIVRSAVTAIWRIRWLAMLPLANASAKWTGVVFGAKAVVRWATTVSPAMRSAPAITIPLAIRLPVIASVPAGGPVLRVMNLARRDFLAMDARNGARSQRTAIRPVITSPANTPVDLVISGPLANTLVPREHMDRNVD